MTDLGLMSVTAFSLLVGEDLKECGKNACRRIRMGVYRDACRLVDDIKSVACVAFRHPDVPQSQGGDVRFVCQSRTFDCVVAYCSETEVTLKRRKTKSPDYLTTVRT